MGLRAAAVSSSAPEAQVRVFIGILMQIFRWEFDSPLPHNGESPGQRPNGSYPQDVQSPVEAAHRLADVLRLAAHQLARRDVGPLLQGRRAGQVAVGAIGFAAAG
jgi:hypothetical protein